MQEARKGRVREARSKKKKKRRRRREEPRSNEKNLPVRKN